MSTGELWVLCVLCVGWDAPLPVSEAVAALWA